MLACKVLVKMKNKQSALSNSVSHVVDILGSTVGRDQPIMLVQTALELVNTLGDEVFLDENVVFLDPFCKAGEILLAIGMRLNKATKKLMNVNKICATLYTQNRIFGLAPDERHWLLSLRTFLGNEKSHDLEQAKIIKNGAYLSEENGNADLPKFKTELIKMIEYISARKPGCKVIAIGNPPYQEADGGFGKSAKPVYNFFSDALMECEAISQFVLVIPARWFGGGKGLDDFREKIISSKHIRNLRYFKNAAEVFPTVDINGGVCFLQWDKSHVGKTNFADGTFAKEISLSKWDIIPDDPMAFEIVEKLQKCWPGKWVGDVAWAGKPFGLRTFYFDRNAEVSRNSRNAVPCLSIRRIIKYADISDITKNLDKIDLWKVCVPKAAGGSKGNRRSTVPKNLIMLVPSGTITTETYNIVHAFKTKIQAENMLEFLKTDFARYLVGTRKITQDLPKDRWNWVPLLDMKETWDDEKLFKFFGFSKKEQEHIKAKVEEWS